ncbi:oxidoreductase [Chromohalobacter japonicus]|uniref:Oxidoreductase n=2 Tax=Chromohalobacter TaxID=42054 RepID=A0A1Q8TDL1_9GAMM|nr:MULTISPECIES: 2Fe-2S iron-sulfur cluster binding domain-containing protein [Chromohalobacter]MCT8467826.1 2Fe-2S iron-sulfur cluster binding domain-containing protein [Chromohalobacter canadensis]MCT8470426.1 2Fe-2S iron-sulfur cluster binding domain-containing protein [Chromohalobacter canadensis]MCT8498323.1 2Fe-2S iron-sulfur cluster binding domain-containing protein [Chromohalobacter canadensis]OLO11771.1 oxidoreductase [Chromohalobacter japonicus]SOC58304.1 NAD(P)H-flavin reductase [Ch
MPEYTIELTTRDAQTLTFPCAEGENVIAAAERADIYLNAQCRSGACGACIARHDGGDFTLGDHSSDALSDADRTQGQVLLCSTQPHSDMRLTLPYEYDLVRFEKTPLRQARITAKTYLNADTVNLELQLEPDADDSLVFDFEPGQFVQLTVPDSDITRPYSLANAPNWDGSLELLIKLHDKGQFSTWLRDTATPGMALSVEGPLGTFVLHDNGLRPRYFVVGGCGLASVVSMLRRMAEWQEPHPVKLFFGVWREQDVFYRQELAALAEEYPNLDYTICASEATQGWPGYHGSVLDAFVQALGEESTLPDVYACGSPGLIDGVARVAAEHGIPQEQVIFERYLASTAANSAASTCCETA